MSNRDLNLLSAFVAIGGAIAFLFITADIMGQYPQIPWFVSGILATLVAEALGYGIYRLVKHVRGGP